MKIAFIHYHLKTGGVTTVLKHQVKALHSDCETLVLTGDRADNGLDGRVLVIPGLGYDRPGAYRPVPEAVAMQVLRAIQTVWPDGCDLIHIHNPTLAKNRRFLQIIKRLQRLGVKLFLQIHDFAEDGRADCYFSEDYPADCHYGVINRRDASILRHAGLKDDGLHLIPNAVTPLPVAPGQEDDHLILYPVRAIRRKNLGEAILLGLFFENDQRLVITQPPNSPADIRSYAAWVAWVEQHRLPVDFEAGRHTDFSVLVGAARAMVTTSIAEGFGFSYLEPWTAGKPLWGRRLADICEDFERQGIRLDGLYDRIDVPMAWIDVNAFSRRWHAAVVRTAETFGCPIENERAIRAFDRLTHGGKIDFGMLSETFQRQVLDRLVKHAECRRRLIAMNPWLAAPDKINAAERTIAENRRTVARHYGISASRARLLEIYQRVIRQPVQQTIDKAALVSAFFDLDRFSLLKWDADAGF